MVELMRHEVRVRRRTILGWTLGLAFFSLMYMTFYPALPQEFREFDVESIDIYRSMGVHSMATFEGYMRSTVLNFLPLLMGAFGIVLGAGALAGEEDAGTLELLASLPVSRLQLFAAKAAAVILAAFAVTLAVATIVALAFLALQSEMDTAVTTRQVFGAVLAHWLVALVFVALGLLLGAYLPSRGSALSAASALLVVTFFGNNLAAMVTDLERFQPLSPFSYFDRVTEIIDGTTAWRDMAVLAVMGGAGLVLGALAFRRRDLTVGAWPWQRPRPTAASSGLTASGVAAPGSGAALRPPRSRRAVAALAAAGLLACGCLATALIALPAAEDLRSELRDRWASADEEAGEGAAVDEAAADERAVGEDAVDKAVGDAVAVDEGAIDRGDPDEDAAEPEQPATPGVPVAAGEAGQLVALSVAAGDEVTAGEALAVVADAAADEQLLQAQRVLELAWAFLDDLAAGTPAVSRGALEADLESAVAAVEAAVLGRNEARAMGREQAELQALEIRLELARAARDVAAARRDLAEGRLSADHVQAALEAVDKAQARVDAAAGPVKLHTVAAPYAGTVTAVHVRPGDVVTANQTLLRIAPR